MRTKLKDGVSEPCPDYCSKRSLASKLRTRNKKVLGDILGPLHGDNRFENLVHLCLVRTPSECASEKDRRRPGTRKVHRAGFIEGVNAIPKIRGRWRPTDTIQGARPRFRFQTREFRLQYPQSNAAPADAIQVGSAQTANLPLSNVGENNLSPRVHREESFIGKI